MPSSSSSSSSTSSSSTTTTTNRVMNNGHRKRNGSSLSNIKKIRRSELVKNSKDERPSRSSLSNSNSLNNITEEYSLTTENNRSSTLRPFGNSYDNNNSDIRRDLNSNKREIGSTENTSNSINKKATALSLIVKSTILNRQDGLQTNLVPSYDSDEELDKTKQNSNKILPMVVTPIITSSNLAKQTLRSDNNSVIIQQANGKSNLSAKIFKVVVPQAIKMLTNGDGLSSALRIPTKIQLTKTSSPIFAINQEQLNDQHQILSATTIDIREKQQSVVDYPLTPPPPPPSIIDIGNTNPHLLKQDSIKESNMVNNKGMKEIDSTISKRHSSLLSDWTVPPTSELSPTSLTSSSPDLSQNNIISDDSIVELDLKNNRSSINRRYRSLSFSSPVLVNVVEQTKPITPPYKSKSLPRITNVTNKKLRSVTPIMTYSSIQRLKKRRKDGQFYLKNQFYAKRSKLKSKNDDENNIVIIRDILNNMIEQVQLINIHKDNRLKILANKPTISINVTTNTIEESRSIITTSNEVKQNKVKERMNEINQQEETNNYKTMPQQPKVPIQQENYSSLLSYDPNNNTSSVELNRQTSTPLSFHSIPPSSSSSAIDDQSLTSPHSQSIVSKTHIFTDIVNELIKGAKGLDKLSCSLVTFTNSIHDFIRLTVEKQNEKIENFQKELEKKCSSQLNRANIFCLKKIQYFTNKHSLISTNEYIEEITLLVKYFYLYVLILNCRKQEHEIELILNDLLNGKLTFINESFDSPIITTTIEDIMSSKLANDYLLSQPLIINQTEHSLPFICNTELENELLFKNETSSTMNPFSDLNDLEDYLNRCEHMSTTIPHYPVQQQPPPPPTVIYHPRYSHPSASAQYYYPSPQPQDMTPYYYHPNTSAYPNSQQQQPYPYNHPSCYYNPLNSYGTTYNTNEQYNFYYNQQTSYSHSHPNSTNDIPSLNNHQSYRRMNSNIQRQYSNPPQENQITPTGFDTCNNISPQSKSTVVPSNMYAP
ncbi:unnamed protein product [Adineta steineri]|uniref:Uncharacterized protein n=3 Tax=Adineta steineri TaxID=433720 RepID=A0A814IAR7_9BILA|nr:unnamed protein product [Adineta steineri]